MPSVSLCGGRSGSLGFYKYVDGVRFVDRDETNGGKYNTVSFGHQSWRFIIARPLNNEGFSFQVVGHSSRTTVGHF